ncbi:SMP-30/gluconolactonase/LRE family protein [Streptomyces coelicoflavus]|uniref:SMP-30/gluconolactonase/LRE family protein n=1 Tax=Streptomyces coelicoflavus TaxID=285562 RepID=UPI003627D817
MNSPKTREALRPASSRTPRGRRTRGAARTAVLAAVLLATAIPATTTATATAATGAATSAASSAPATFADVDVDADSGVLPQTVTASSPELYPEGVAWDPTREAFLVTSARQGTVSVVEADGSVRELTPSLGLVSTLGIRVDARRGRILVAYSDYWVRRMLPVDQPPTSGVAVIDLASGRLVKKIDTARGRQNTFANDLAVDERTGTVYVTDSVSDTLQQIDVRGRVSDLVTDDRFSDEHIGLNGIAWHPGGYLLVTRHDSGAMFRITPDRTPRVSRVVVPASLAGVDGLALRRDGTLLAVQNTLGAANGMPGGVNAVSALASDDCWRTARLTRRVEPWPEKPATTVAVTGRGAYTVSGQMDVLMSGSGEAQEFWLNRLPF